MTKNQIPNAEIEAAFKEAKGNMSKAAKIIGCTREALWARVKKSEELAETLRECRLEDEEENGPETEEINKVEIPNYTKESGKYIFEDGIEIRVRDVKFVVNSINPDLRQTIEESAGRTYEQIIIERRYKEILAEQAKKQAELAEQAKREQINLEKSKAWCEEQVHAGRIIFYDLKTGEMLINKMPADLTNGSFIKIRSLEFASINPHAVSNTQLLSRPTSNQLKSKYEVYYFK